LHDRRSVRIKVSAKGKALRSKLDEFFDRDAKQLMNSGMGPDQLTALGDELGKLERFWASRTDTQMRAG
jgi:DNA-binding MarR family transcriptional regulator